MAFGPHENAEQAMRRIAPLDSGKKENPSLRLTGAEPVRRIYPSFSTRNCQMLSFAANHSFCEAPSWGLCYYCFRSGSGVMARV